MFETFFEIFFQGFEFLLVSFWVWGPIIFLFLAVKAWKAYIHAHHIAGLETTMLEVRLPKEITKSPLAMELFLNHLYQPFGIDSLKAKWWDGKLVPWFSLELVSIDGKIRFFIWMQEKHKQMIETQIYAAYPSVEVVVAEDYSKDIEFNLEKMDLTGARFGLSKADEYPIKTYVDYGLDKDPKEEHKIDPMSPVIEFLGTILPGEQAWFQILVRAHTDKPKGSKWIFFTNKTKWKDEGAKLVKKLAKRDEDKEKEEGPRELPTERERQVIEAVERNLSKTPFDCGIRGVYLARKEIFNKGNIAGIAGTWAQYASGDLNGFKPGGVPFVTYKWQDPRGKRVAFMKWVLFDAYRRRAWFYAPHKMKPFVLSSEELATIYHFPGDTVKTPTFPRIESKKSEPPSNLPV